MKIPDVKIRAHNNQYDELFWSSLYNTMCNRVYSEISTIWKRYTAFLIAQGAILGFFGKNYLEDRQGLLILLVGFIGILLSCIWHIMNYLGWLHQNLWLWQAGRIKFIYNDIRLELPTKCFDNNFIRLPFGAIYNIAQTLPVIFLFANGIMIGFGFYYTLADKFFSISIALLVIYLCAIIALKVEYRQSRQIVSGLGPY